MSFPLFGVKLPGKLSASESAELAVHVAAMARAGLPLEAGLRALAGEIRPRRLGRVLRRLAGQLSAGVPLEQAIAAQGSRLPASLRGLIVAGVRTGRLAQVLDDFVNLARSQQALRRRAVLSLAYPTLLLAAMAGLLVFFQVYLTDEFSKIFADFGCKLPIVTTVFFATSHFITWGLAGVAAVLAALPLLSYLAPWSGWLSGVLSWVPVLGPILRWGGLAQLAQLMAMLLAQEVPLPEALRLAAAGLSDARLATGCRRVAAEVKTGTPLNEALYLDGCFPYSMAALVAGGQKGASTAEAFYAAAEMFEARARAQTVLLDIVLPPVFFLTITAFIAFFMAAVLLPLVSLITNLSK